MPDHWLTQGYRCPVVITARTGKGATIVPKWKAPEGYAQPRFFYTVDVLGVQADSTDAKAKGLLTFVDDLTVQVVGAQRGAPYAEQDVELTLADGSTRTETTDGDGRVELSEIPPGPAKVALPELGTPDEEAEAAARSEHASMVVATETPDGAPSAQLVTGSTWQVAAGLSGTSHGH